MTKTSPPPIALALHMRVALGAHSRLLTSQTRRRYHPRPNSFLLPTSPPRISIGLWSLGSSKTLTGPLCCRAMAPCTPVVRVRDKIDITDAERRIFDHLLGTLSHCNLQTQLRVAGGWVRDKLLGKECYDIDIAIDNMVGREFCEKLAEYLSFIGEKTKGAGVVPCNPEQSKHLETATMQVCDIWIDFVNLRSEDYSENSRIPTMRFGSPKEDAYRRDLTINSLFYNINTSSVEDFTGRGIADLKAGKIVTPLPPKDTFLDDPLRVLRAIRFGARFEFVLAEELMKAAACDDVRSALAQKISRERIGHEVDLMISGNQPVQAMKYIFDLNLFWTVFSLPSCFEPLTSEECHRSCVAYMDAAWSLIQLIGLPTFSDEQRKLCLYAAMFLPLRATVYKDKKSKQIAVVNYIFLNSLKLKSSYATTVMNIHSALDNFKSLIPSVILNNDVGVTQHDRVKFSDVPFESTLRVAAGMVVREMHGFWRVALLVLMLLYPSDIDASWCVLDRHSQLDRRTEIFTHVESAIVKLGLEKVWEEKPLVNGREIMSILQLKTGGPLIKEWQHRLLEWQLAHPLGTPDECRNWMMETCSNSKRTKFE